MTPNIENHLFKCCVSMRVANSVFFWKYKTEMTNLKPKCGISYGDENFRV